MARTLAITQNITLDGSIEMLGDWFSPQAQAEDAELVEALAADEAANDGFLVGRRTFEDLRGYWPGAADVDQTGVSEHLDRVEKYVVSSTIDDPQWQRTTIIRGDGMLDAIADLKQEPGEDIVVTGSIRLCHALLEAGLVDQVRLFTYPVVQGRGRRLFPDGMEVPRLDLLDVRGFRSGLTYARYALS